MDLENVIDQLKHGNTEEAIEKLFEQLNQHQLPKDTHTFYSELILISGQMQGILQEKRLGLINRENFSIEKNKVSKSILDLIATIRHSSQIDKDSQKTTPTQDIRQQIKAIHDNTTFEYDIFFSFSSKNQEEAQYISRILRGYGLKVFQSNEILKSDSGQSFFSKIDYALTNSKHFMLLCTPEAMNSEWVKVEYETFFNEYYLKSRQARRLIIMKGKRFELELLPSLLRTLQIAGEPKDIIQTFVDEDVAVKGVEKQKGFPVTTRSFFIILISVILLAGIGTVLYFQLNSRPPHAEKTEAKTTLIRVPPITESSYSYTLYRERLLNLGLEVSIMDKVYDYRLHENSIMKVFFRGRDVTRDLELKNSEKLYVEPGATIELVVSTRVKPD